MKRINIQINIEGDLPEKYTSKKWLDKIKQRILDDVKEIFGEYELWGEYFGDDDEIYTFFLKDIKINVDKDVIIAGEKNSGVKMWIKELNKRKRNKQQIKCPWCKDTSQKCTCHEGDL